MGAFLLILVSDPVEWVEFSTASGSWADQDTAPGIWTDETPDIVVWIPRTTEEGGWA